MSELSDLKKEIARLKRDYAPTEVAPPPPTKPPPKRNMIMWCGCMEDPGKVWIIAPDSLREKEETRARAEGLTPVTFEEWKRW